MENAFSITQLWSQGDGVSHFVALALLLMSILSWTVLLSKTWLFMRANRHAKQVDQTFWHSPSLAVALQHLTGQRSNNPYLALALEGQQAVEHHAHAQDDLHGALSLSDWLTSCLKRSIEESSARLQSGLAVLASIGSTAPFVGLFGTVWGIYHALMKIGTSGESSIEKIAGPVGEALVMTALGLAVAIPAVLAYNALIRAHKAQQSKLNHFAHDLHAYWITGARVVREVKQVVKAAG
ncbi:MotA/TolQ/ExbB proton channel family protein [Parvibium lacunae]|uniref:Biopolymer transport protein ExbB n=1 Tax=Parvibium lacunae TaxID=1888893 RepID=A0A368L484_9BURK|nr:MotA/TolQ/ExbB proton channel family protein [Parvibium lacunae]RCS58377.1 MotA/TolQ/ExbB proton channel family protein [Parvibium lacunae]